MEHTRIVVESILGSGIHLARVRSIANGVAGVLNASKISIAAVGRAYAGLAGIHRKSGIKQLDRLLSNQRVELEQVLSSVGTVRRRRHVQAADRPGMDGLCP